MKLRLEGKYVSRSGEGDNLYANLKHLEIYSAFYKERPGAGTFQVTSPSTSLQRLTRNGSGGRCCRRRRWR